MEEFNERGMINPLTITQKRIIEKHLKRATMENRVDLLEKFKGEEYKINNVLYHELVSPHGIKMENGLDIHILELLHYFEENEEYEKCGELNVVLKWYNSQLIAG